MRRAAVGLILILPALTEPATAGPETDRDAVQARRRRRARVAKEIGPGYALLLGQPRAGIFQPPQEGHFLYLTGVDEPGAGLLLRGAKAKRLRGPWLDGGEAGPLHFREALLVVPYPEEIRRFFGYRLEPGPDTARELGIETVLPAAGRAGGRQLGHRLSEVLPPKSTLHIPGYRRPDDGFLRAVRERVEEVLARERPDVRIENLHPTLARMRAVKEPLELESLRRACAITVEALQEALPEIRPASTEAAVDGAL
ncbi:MAG: hypothetical protein ACE5JG_12205, partial [Planctomycetota bacterium]